MPCVKQSVVLVSNVRLPVPALCKVWPSVRYLFDIIGQLKKGTISKRKGVDLLRALNVPAQERK